MNPFPNRLAVLIVALGCVLSAGPAAAEPAETGGTRVTPHMDVPIEQSRNILFCSIFQLAWNEMIDGVIGEDIRLEKSPDLVRHLNQGRIAKADIGEGDCLVMAGYGADDIAGKINRGLRSKFGDAAPVVDNMYNDDDIILAYAFLWKELEFEHAFEDFSAPIRFHANGGDTPVEGFGVMHYSDERHSNLRDQAEIVEYTDTGEFIVVLASKHPDDEIVLACVAPGATLLQTYENVKRRIEKSRRGGGTTTLSKSDVLLIPKFEVALNHRYSELLGLHLRNKGFEPYFIAEARQDVMFRLAESGAAAKSEAMLMLKKGPVHFKLLRFDRPFLLYLSKRGASRPYLAIWAENTDLMVKNN